MDAGARTISVPRFSRAPTSGVWYYHVDVAPSAGPAAYSVLRRYSDFLDLYGHVRAALEGSPAARGLPAFPEKEAIPPALFGPKWRLSTPRAVLERRRSAFEALLQWLEQRPAARRLPAFADFLGQPPQLPDVYTSLKEYAPPRWPSAAELAAARAKDPRRRRAYTMDALESRRGSVGSSSGSVKSEPPPRNPPSALAALGRASEPPAEVEVEPGDEREAEELPPRKARRGRPRTDPRWRSERVPRRPLPAERSP